MAATLDTVIGEIKSIQQNARAKGFENGPNGR